MTDELHGGQKFILGILVVGLILVIGIYISATLQSNFQAPGTASNIVNETIAKPVGTAIVLLANNSLDKSCGAVTSVLNNTAPYRSIALGNFTQVGCTLNNATLLENYSSTLLVSYPFTYTADTTSSLASASLVTALSSGTAWITILIVVGFAVIVLGYLTNGLRNAASGREEGPAY